MRKGGRGPQPYVKCTSPASYEYYGAVSAYAKSALSSVRDLDIACNKVSAKKAKRGHPGSALVAYWVEHHLAPMAKEHRRLAQLPPNTVLDVIFDNYPPHLSSAVEKALKENNLRRVTGYPASSYELNMIECVWHDLKRELERLSSSSLKGFFGSIQTAWGNVRMEAVKAHVDRFEGQCRKCVQAEGRRWKA